MSRRLHLILVGLPGAGKTTVASIAGGLLEAAVHDLDSCIVAESGLESVAQVFETMGERWFRQTEKELMTSLLAGEPSVIAAGGGWAVQEGNLVGSESRALAIYLSVSPEQAAQRLGDASDRPLLAGNVSARLAQLLVEREAWYRLAGMELDGRGSPELVAEGVATAARQYAGW